MFRGTSLLGWWVGKDTKGGVGLTSGFVEEKLQVADLFHPLEAGGYAQEYIAHNLFGEALHGDGGVVHVEDHPLLLRLDKLLFQQVGYVLDIFQGELPGLGLKRLIAGDGD